MNKFNVTKKSSKIRTKKLDGLRCNVFPAPRESGTEYITNSLPTKESVNSKKKKVSSKKLFGQIYRVPITGNTPFMKLPISCYERSPVLGNTF